MKLKKGVKITLVIVAIVIILLVGYYLLFEKKTQGASPTVKVINEIKEYGYQLPEDKPKLYKSLFTSLEKTLAKDSVDEEEYASLLAKMFVVDFYTLDNKVAKTDVGGAEFVATAAREDFLEKAMDTVYKYVESNMYGDRKQELPTVKKAEIVSVTKDSFTYLDEVDKTAYIVKVEWDYEKDMGYEKEATLTFVHEGNKLVLVEMD